MRLGTHLRSMNVIARRFWSKVAKTKTCWLWMASKGIHGYGQFGVGEKVIRAHRVAWELTHGPVPEGLCVLHRCDVRACVNPDHLFVGTLTDNNRDMAVKGRHGRVASPERTARGERHGSAKLSEIDVRKIRLLAGMEYKALAGLYGVSVFTIGRILRRESWCHI